MPMTDIFEDGRAQCPFCRYYLTDVDGAYECMEGCGAYTSWDTHDGLHLSSPIFPFMRIENVSLSAIYNSEGKVVKGESASEWI